MSHELDKRHPTPSNIYIPPWGNPTQEIVGQAKFNSAIDFIEAQRRKNDGHITEAAHDAYIEVASEQARFEERNRLNHNGGMRIRTSSPVRTPR